MKATKTEHLRLRLDRPLYERLSQWCEKRKPEASISQAVRYFIEAGLAAEKKGRKAA